MIEASYSSTTSLGEINWHHVEVTEDKFIYLTENPELAPQRAQEGIEQGWLNVLGL